MTYKSTSAMKPQATKAFLSLMIAVLLDLNQYDVKKKLSNELKAWQSHAADFTTKFGLRRIMTKVMNAMALHPIIPDEVALELHKALKAAMPAIDREQDITTEQLKFLKDVSTNLRTSSESSWIRIHDHVRMLGVPHYNQIFIKDDAVSSNEVKKAAADAQAVCKKLGLLGKTWLPQERAISLRTENEALFKKYSAAVKILNANYKTQLYNFVRLSGRDRVPIDEIRAYFDKAGVPHNLPIGFKGGSLDDKGNAYTEDGLQLDRTPFGEVRMNPKYVVGQDNTYVMNGVDHKHRYRTLSFWTKNKVARHDKVREFLKTEAQHRRAWISDLTNKGKDGVMSTIVEIIYSTSGRIGGKENATAGEPTYGVSTLLCKHVKITPKLIIFNYPGKKGAPQDGSIKIDNPTAKRVAANLQKYMEGKGPNDVVFETSGKPVNRAMVNTYLRSKGVEISIHRFRQLAGTKATMEVLKKSPFVKRDAPKQAEVEKWFKEEAKYVGEILHHRTGDKVTAMTAVKSYIEPEIISEFFVGLGLRVPKWVPKSSTQ